MDQTMNWIRLHHDRVIALAGAAFLFCCASFISWEAVHLDSTFASAQSAPAPRAAAPPAKAVELEEAAEKLQQPGQWTFAGRSGLFVPEKHFIDANGMPATLQNTEIHPPVPNQWLEQFGLPIAEADVLAQDADGDGFTNFDEWEGRTNPTERASHPAYVTKLKMKSFSKQTFPLIFASWVEDTFAINTVDQRQPTQFLKIGDMIRGTRFRITGFAEKYQPDRFGTRMDVSEVTLQHEDSKEQLTLVKERVSISPESVANFLYGWGQPREFAVKKDQEFTLKPEEQIKYKLVDVQPDKAVLESSQAPNESIEIGPLPP
ncbi:MAG: Amuc_1099 family pilus-like system protein [Chthoniobacterales bacterium]